MSPLHTAALLLNAYVRDKRYEALGPLLDLLDQVRVDHPQKALMERAHRRGGPTLHELLILDLLLTHWMGELDLPLPIDDTNDSNRQQPIV